MNSKDYKKVIVDALKDILALNQYKHRGNLFSYSNGDLTYFINIQSSQESTTAVLRFTLNIEIYSAVVYQRQDTSMSAKDSRHFIERVGYFLDEPHDKWWAVTNEKELQEATTQISNLLLDKVLPLFDTLKTTNDLANLWLKGKSPGLTNSERKEYLKLLGY